MFSAYIHTQCTTRNQTREDFACGNMGYLWASIGLPNVTNQKGSVHPMWFPFCMSVLQFETTAYHSMMAMVYRGRKAMASHEWRQVHLAMRLARKIISPQRSPCVPCASSRRTVRLETRWVKFFWVLRLIMIITSGDLGYIGYIGSNPIQIHSSIFGWDQHPFIDHPH